MDWKLYAGGSMQVTKHGRPQQKNVPGGWACVIKDRDHRWEKELSHALLAPTIEKMNLLAVVRGLEFIDTFSPDRENNVQIFSTSQYVFKKILELIPAQKKQDFQKCADVATSWLDVPPHQCRKEKEGSNEDMCATLETLLRSMTVAFTRMSRISLPREHEHCQTLAILVRRKLAKELGYL